MPHHSVAFLGTALRLGLGGPIGILLLSLLALLAAGVATVAYRRTQPALSAPRRALLLSLRTLAFLLLLTMIAEPVLQQRHEVVQPPGVLLLVDGSGSMGIVDQDGRSRHEVSRELADRVGEILRGRGEGIRIWRGEGGRRLLASWSWGEPSPEEDPAGGDEGTDLASLLLSGAHRHLEDHLEAILLLSDGVTTDRSSPSLAGLDIPVFPVRVGSERGVADLRLDRVRYPPLVVRGEELEIEADLVAESEDAVRSMARLVRGGVTEDSLAVSWPPGGGRQTVRFRVAADSLGTRRYGLELEPLAEEALLQNNRSRIGFEVRKRRLRIVHVESTPSWNLHFLARHAARDPRFELTGLHRGENGWRVAGSDSSWSWPRNVEELGGVDLWIVGTWTDWQQLLDEGVPLDEAVRQGAGLWVLAGPARGALPRLSARASAPLPLRPVGVARWNLARHRVRTTARATGHPVLAFPPEMGPPHERLAELPPLWAAIGGLEPREDADLLLELESGPQRFPLLALREEGLGQVASWAGSPLWSWSFWRLGEHEGEAVFDALVGNLLHLLAEGGARTRLRLELPAAVLAQGQEALARGVVLDTRLQPDSRQDVWLEWAPGAVSEGDSLRESTGRARMRPDPRTPGGRVLELPSLPPGDYAFRMSLEEGDERLHSPWANLEVDPYSVEFRQPRADGPALRRIAEATGGRPLDPGELAEWARTLALAPRVATLGGRLELWSSLWLLLPFLLLLSLEWALRKRWGLV